MKRVPTNCNTSQDDEDAIGRILQENEVRKNKILELANESVDRRFLLNKRENTEATSALMTPMKKFVEILGIQIILLDLFCFALLELAVSPHVNQISRLVMPTFVVDIAGPEKTRILKILLLEEYEFTFLSINSTRTTLPLPLLYCAAQS